MMTITKGQKIRATAAVLGAAVLLGSCTMAVLSERGASGPGFSDVVVTRGDLGYGVRIEREMLKIARYPKDAIPAGAFASLDQVAGQTTKVFMVAREPITAIKLSTRGGGLSTQVPPDMRAASIEVSRVAGVSGLLLPGDRVDALITADPYHSGLDAVTRTLLRNVTVLSAGQSLVPSAAASPAAQTVTLLVDPRGAEMLAHAQRQGEIHLVLRNPEDRGEAKVAAYSTRDMFGATATAAAPRDPKPAVIAPVAPPESSIPAQPPSIRIIRGADVSGTPLVRDTVTASN